MIQPALSWVALPVRERTYTGSGLTETLSANLEKGIVDIER